jgi:hypothetical protein
VVLALLATAVAGWAVVAKLSGGEAHPAATPPPPVPSYATPTQPPPWGTDPRGSRLFVTMYRSTPLDGHWASRRLTKTQAGAVPGTTAGERVTLQFRSTALAVWAGPRSHRRLLAYDAVYVDGHRVQLTRVGADGKALYRWQVADDRLTFRLVHRTEGASASSRMVTVAFRRVG